MGEYLRRAKEALAQFRAALDAFDKWRAGAASAAGLTDKQIKRLSEIAERLRAAVRQIEHSLTQIAGETALDLVDLQVRMEGETAALASALKALDEIVAKTRVMATDGGALYDVEEGAARLAAAIFPHTIDGLRDINRALWDFRPLWSEYTRTLAKEVAKPAGKGLTTDQLAKVEQTANQVRARFDDVNALLNELAAAGAVNGPAVQSLIRKARQALSVAVREAKSKAGDAYKPFHGVLKRAEALARKIDGQFAGLRVPVFPDAGRLEDLVGRIDAPIYKGLAGVERFALLNIGARLRSIPLARGVNGHLLGPQFGIRVFAVFPDRVYFTAHASFIAAIQALKDTGVFEDAPGFLHRFNEGSFKQRGSRKGNLQVSFAFGSPEQPNDATKVRVDADIDLYRSPVLHLFGEVLVNHLTGSKTDQFKVWDTLASNDVVPIGGFDVVSV
jgi:hypothetical protein